MSQEEKALQATVQEQAVKQAVKDKKAQENVLLDSINKLAKFGGFTFLESSIDGVQNLNPERKARKKIFLTDESKREERKELQNQLGMWIDLLSETKNTTEMLDKSKEKESFVSELLDKNLMKAVETVKELERSYRSVI